MIDITYFVHGTTTDNLDQKASGWNDCSLCEKGISQAIALAQTIKNQEFDVVFCSDLIRAVESAKLDFYNRDITIVKDSRLRECNYGDYNGQDHKLVNYYLHFVTPFPNGECLRDVEDRVRDFVEFLKENYDGKKVAIVSHRAPQLALDVILNGKHWDEALDQDWRHTKAWQPGWKYSIE